MVREAGRSGGAAASQAPIMGYNSLTARSTAWEFTSEGLVKSLGMLCPADLERVRLSRSISSAGGGCTGNLSFNMRVPYQKLMDDIQNVRLQPFSNIPNIKTASTRQPSSWSTGCEPRVHVSMYLNTSVIAHSKFLINC
jgi:hypothetical protein